MKASKFSNFSSSGSAGTDDKKAFAQSTIELRALLETCAASTGDDALSAALQRVSQLLSAIGATHFPFAKPSWSKEILAFFAVVSAAKEGWLSVQDFACISRVLTRASAEKQLPPNAAEAEGLYKLLIGFIKHKGSNCRDGSVPLIPAGLLAAPSATTGSGLLHALNANQGLIVIHEVLRGVAQLLLTAPERLQAYRFESLSALLPFCDRHAVDVETRYTAIDAVGNLLSHKVGTEALALLPSELALFSGGSSEGGSSEKGRQLLLLQEACHAALIDNLRNSVSLLTAVAAPAEDGAMAIACPPSRLLVSCLRTLAQAILASSSAPPGLCPAHAPTQHPVLQQSFQSLLQTAYTIFSVIVPPLAGRDADDARSRDQAAADRGAGEHTESKLLLHAYRFLGALASLDPQLFMRSWQLFLTDSIATDNSLAAAVRSAAPVSSLPAFRSPLLVGASRAAPAVRVAAVQCLRSLLAGLPLRKWFRATVAAKRGRGAGHLGESVTNTIVKILRFAVLALAIETHEAAVQELLLLAQTLAAEMPLGALGAPPGGSPLLEDLARALFSAVMRVAACECAVQGRPEARVAASQGAAEWLDRQIGSRPPLAAFADALALTSINASSASDALHSLHGAAAGASVNSSSWRGASAKSAPPRAEANATIDFKRSFCGMAVLSTEQAPSGAHGLACRNLCTALVSNYGAHMLADGPWLRSLVDLLLGSPLAQLRLLGCRIVSCDLLRRTNGPAANGMAVLGCYDAGEATNVLLRLCADSDHQSRGQAVACLGNYPRWLWARLEGSPSRESVLGALLEASADKVGNVRAAACKALGDTALHGGLALRPADSFTGEAERSEALGASEAAFVAAMLRQLHGGCADSKLAVRLQAVWALGSLLLMLLPLRRQEVFSPDLHSPDSRRSMSDSISDEAWLASCDRCTALLADSEKLLPSTVRCLGFVTAGLSPLEPAHFAQLSSIVDTLVNKILFTDKDAAVSLNDWDYYGDERYLVQRRVETLPHKLVYSICQSLGFVGWVIVTSHAERGAEATGGAPAMLERARNVLAVMLRHDTLKIRLQACKALLALICGEHRAVVPGGAYSSSVVTALDGALKLVSGLRPRGAGSTPDGKRSAGAPSSAADSVQVAKRSSALQRALLVLLWVILDPSAAADQRADAASAASQESEGDESVTMVSQSLVFHSDDLMEWLGGVALLEGKPLCLSELSLTPPQLALTVPAIAMPESATARDIARRVCRGVARLLALHAQISSGRDADSRGWLSSVYATAEAWERLQETLGDGPVNRTGSPANKTTSYVVDSALDDDEI